MTDNNQITDESDSNSLTVKIEKTAQTREKLRTTWGRGEKHTPREQYALLFVSRLHTVGGRFSFTQEHRDFGYENIWEAFAGEHHEPAANTVQKVHNAEEWAAAYRAGCTQLNDKLLEEWDDVQVFLIPSTVDGLLIHHITIDPDYVVNAAGETALTIWEQRELKRANGRVRSVARKLARATSPQAALAQIAKIASADNLVDMVQLPPGKLEHSP